MRKSLALEPLDIDLTVDGQDMSEKERKEVSAFIRKNRPNPRLRKKLDALRHRLKALPPPPTWEELTAAQKTRTKTAVGSVERSVKAVLAGKGELTAAQRRVIAEKIERYRKALTKDAKKRTKTVKRPTRKKAKA